jgi:solute carrier family 35 (UDP-xylose/UDP-N-acetylglucosamine transporter), member B4
MKDYVTLVTVFFVTNICNNYAFNFNIPMPLHMIFRSGSLMANMVMGIVILRKSYDLWKHFSVVLITIGIVICTIASGSSLKKESEKTEASDGVNALAWLSVGIALLTAALFLSARMGIYQEVLYKKYGKHPDEALFFTHLLPLPGFLLLSSSIYQHTVIAFETEPYQLLGIVVPIQVLYLIGNMVTQYMCIGSVYVLTSECPSLTVTLVVTLRKFASLIFSIIYFKNPFTLYHWIGALFVFIGTVIFTEIVPNVMKQLGSPENQQQAETNTVSLTKLKAFASKRKSFVISKIHGSYKKFNSETHAT